MTTLEKRLVDAGFFVAPRELVVERLGGGGLGSLGEFFLVSYAKKVSQWITNTLVPSQATLKKAMMIIVPAIALATGLAILGPLAGLPAGQLAKMIGSKGTSLIKGGATYVQRVVMGAGRFGVALLTKKEYAELREAGVTLATAAISAEQLQRFTGVDPLERVMPWDFSGGSLQIPTPNAPEIISTDNQNFFDKYKSWLIPAGVGVVVLLAMKGRK